MINIKNLKDKHIFFVGIGGISMSSLTQFCHKFGANVSGSDISINAEVKKLSKMGVPIFIGHSEKNLPGDVDLVVYSGAIANDNPELRAAKKLGVNICERSEFLGYISKQFLNTIVVAGTHGKTTTTAMLGDIFIKSMLKPSIHLGGESVSFGNYLLGNKDLFITEGCEYRNSIKYLQPFTSVITSIELDHTDYYNSFNDIEDVFLNLANNTKENVIVFENIAFSKKITSKVNVVNVGFGKDYDVRGENLTLNKNGTYAFDVYYYNIYIGKFISSLVGICNAKNTLCAIATGLVYDVPIGDMYNAVRNFKGVKRRFEEIGEINGVPVICDYANHPTEILNSINTANQIYGTAKVIFQPHTYSRTIGLKEEFINAFNFANNLVIFKTYPAREKYIVGGSAKELFNDIKHNKKSYIDTRKALKEEFVNNTSKCILVLGAGDIYDITKSILKSMKINN